MVGGGIRHFLAALAQPALHELDLVRLRGIDAAGHVDDRFPVGALRNQCRHLHGLVVVRNHVLHELGVGGRMAGARNVDSLFRAELSIGFARGARLDDGHIAVGDADAHEKH